MKATHYVTNVFGLLVAAYVFSACGGKKSDATDGKDTVRTVRTPNRVDEVLGIAVIEPAKRISQLSPESGGLVKSISVDIGQVVRKGDVILTMDNAVETAQLRQASVKIQTQQDAIETARQNVQTLRVQLQKAEDDLKRNQMLFSGKALTRKELDDSQYQVTNLQQQIRASEAQVKQAEGQIKQLRSDIQYASTVAGLKTVKAPESGTILSLEAKVGQYLNSNQSIGDFAPEGPLVAVTEIDELFALRVKVGQKAYVRPQGSSERLTTGTVILASPYLRKKSLFSDNTANLEDRRVREVRVQLDDPTKVIIGARVECLIQVGSQPTPPTVAKQVHN
ncbi:MULTISPECIES: HlyD family efflux transporter periplasmic adaptor subunit [unclassified Spirosoma]|uniref:HlyD family secretion protein n=1 Tax=unclassified Spirosoma TaxID=2621999 RepID=UPI00095C2DFF|nr:MULTISPECIES: HlyD family efflux transporter periplasmic adaptor subunit [unclassified Spirosoma]MBN8822531.1 HlyD family efflux transporter periplasmic adaptor subunit [Spirosoma sp.]OJW74298.1 MAG: secretion protein HlyD [Spirosoma sp. 48-14]